MNWISIYQLRKKFLYFAIFFIPLSGLRSFVPYFSYTLIFISLYIGLTIISLKRESQMHKISYAFIALIMLYILILISSIVNFEPNTVTAFSNIRQLFFYIFIFYFLSHAFSSGLLTVKSVLIYYLLGALFLLALFFLGFDRSIDVESGRLTLLGVNSNKTSIFMSIAVLFCLNILQYYRFSATKRFLIYSIISGFIYVMVLTGSRGGVIGLALAVLVYYYYKEQGLRKRFKSISFGLFMIVALALLVLSNDILYSRFFLIDNSSILNDRYLIWDAVQTIISENLIFGIGVFKYEIEITRLLGEYRATHNEYLTIIVYAGVLGLLFFIFFLFQVLKSALKSAKKQKNSLFISLFVLLLFSLFKGGGLLLSILIWFLFVFILYSNEILTHESSLEEG